MSRPEARSTNLVAERLRRNYARIAGEMAAVHAVRIAPKYNIADCSHLLYCGKALIL